MSIGEASEAATDMISSMVADAVNTEIVDSIDDRLSRRAMFM